MAKKYKPTLLLINKGTPMELTFNEKELNTIIEAGLKAHNYPVGIIDSISVSQSRKTQESTITIEMDVFGINKAVAKLTPKAEVTEAEPTKEVIVNDTPKAELQLEDVSISDVGDKVLTTEVESVVTEVAEPSLETEEDENTVIFDKPKVDLMQEVIDETPEEDNVAIDTSKPLFSL